MEIIESKAFDVEYANEFNKLLKEAGLKCSSLGGCIYAKKWPFRKFIASTLDPERAYIRKKIDVIVLDPNYEITLHQIYKKLEDKFGIKSVLVRGYKK